MGVELYVGGLAWAVEDADLRRFVESKGFAVRRAEVKTDRDTGRSRGFGFVTLADDLDVDAAIRALNGANLKGRPIRVNEAEGNRARPPGSGRERRDPPRQSASAGISPVATFVHPYNFVSVPADGLGKAAEVAPFLRGPSAPHDRYLAKGKSGHIECVLTTKTWWFIPDPRKRHKPGEHLTAGYATMDPMDTPWNPEDDVQGKTRPFVPAASLRGMVRSVFEAATLSCLSVFDPEGLDFRVPFDLAWKGETVPDEQRPSYVPARVVEKKDGSVSIQLLNGRRQGDPGNTLPVALVYAYDPRVEKNGRVGTNTVLWSRTHLSDGSAVAALVDRDPQEKWKEVKRTGKKFLAYRYREVHELVPADQATSLKPRAGQWLVFGYLHRTGPNIENKHHERVFFHADAPYNESAVGVTKAEIGRRLAAFEMDRGRVLTVQAAVVKAAEASLVGYAERHKRDRPRASAIGPGAPFPSDFVGTQKITKDDLYYALVEGTTEVRGLYPVALPRLAHEDDRGVLLPADFHACDEPKRLCPACRVFGWVRPVPPGQPLPKDPNRVDAVAGHVRFGHGILQGVWGAGDRVGHRTTLAILGSPKPTTTAFYLEPREGFEDARQQRWPPVLREDKVVHPAVPLYRQEEATLRGRKFYRRRARVDPASDDPATSGLRRSPGDDGRPVQDDQNQTVYLLPPGMEFRFRVDFDNLSPEELGALVFALTLQAPKTWSASRLRHALGRGKPLGMGACEVRLECIQIDRFEGEGHRYARVPAFSTVAVPASRQDPDVASLVEPFEAAWSRIAAVVDLARVRDQLVEMLCADPPVAPVHYPPNIEGESDKNFTWFVANKKAGDLLPDPIDERQDANSRLPGQPSHRGPR